MFGCTFEHNLQNNIHPLAKHEMNFDLIYVDYWTWKDVVCFDKGNNPLHHGCTFFGGNFILIVEGGVQYD